MRKTRTTTEYITAIVYYCFYFFLMLTLAKGTWWVWQQPW